MTSIALIACSSSKLSALSAPAGQLYTSALFKKSRDWAVHHADSWFILSAKYGLVDPKQVIENYNVTLNTMGVAERRRWSQMVFTSITQRSQPGDEIIFLAGQNYRGFLEQPLAKMGYIIRIPLKGLRIGEQLQWLERNQG